MPAVLIEAGPCRLPCLSSDVEAIPEVVLDTVTGHLLAHADDQGWAAPIERVAHDPLGARAMGDAARGHCLERFDIDVVSQAWSATVDAL
jgi:glycosyltransferase involved in cell wall biosynthesis